MSNLSKPNSVSDGVWDDIVAVAKQNDRLKVMAGYKELAEKPGEFQKYYKEMYEQKSSHRGRP